MKCFAHIETFFQEEHFFQGKVFKCKEKYRIEITDGDKNFTVTTNACNLTENFFNTKKSKRKNVSKYLKQLSIAAFENIFCIIYANSIDK